MQALTPNKTNVEHMMNLDGFEMFDARARAPRKRASRVRMNGYGEFVLDAEILALLGNPSHVRLWYKNDTHEVAIQRATVGEMPAYKVAKRRGRQGFISCRTFVDHHHLHVGWTVENPFVHDGVVRFTVPPYVEPDEPKNEFNIDT